MKLAALVLATAPFPAARPPAQESPLRQGDAARFDATSQSAAPAPAQAETDLSAKLEEIRAKAGAPALAAALVTVDGGLQGVWVAGKRRADADAPVTADDLWHLGSCTKSMTATLVALLVARGDMKWDVPLGDLLPELADGEGDEMNAAFTDVTLVELLCHRAGLSRDMDFGLLAGLRTSGDTLIAQREKILKSALMRVPANEPRSQFLYSNDGFVIAGHLAERATKRPWEELIQELLFDPLGMTSAGFGAPGKEGALDQPRGHGGDGKPIEPGPLADNPAAIGPAGTVHASLADWAKYVQLHLKGFRGDVKVGGITLTKELFARLHTPFDGQGQAYGYGWVHEKRPWAGDDGTALWHNGSNTLWYCVTWLGPANGMAVLVTTNSASAAAQKATDDAAGLLIQEYQRRAGAKDSR